MCNSAYYSDDDFVDLVSNKDTCFSYLSMLHCNIRSLSKNCDNLEKHLKCLNHDFDIIAITESWLTRDNCDIHYLHDYQHIYKYRDTKKGGGVSVFVRNQFKYIERPDLGAFNTDIECIFIELIVDMDHVLIGSLYRPPNTNSTAFLEYLDTVLELCSKEKKKLYLLGDFNLDLLKHDSHDVTNRFLNLMYSNVLLPLINRPTRVTCNTATLIDNIITNVLDNNCISGIYPTDISDHFPVFHISYSQKHIVTSNPPRNVRLINNTTLSKFKSKIETTNWVDILNMNNVQEVYDKFIQTLTNIYNDTIPITKLTPRKNPHKPWLTKALITSIKKKNKLYSKYLKYKINTDHEIYKKYKNKLNHLLGITEKNHYAAIFLQNKSNLKNTWNILRDIINKKKQIKKNYSFKHNNAIISNPKLICNNFNNYFLHVGKSLSSKIPAQDTDPISHLSGNYTHSFYFKPATEMEISNIINKLKNNSPGHDDLGAILFKIGRESLIPPLCHICNLSMTCGKYTRTT